MASKFESEKLVGVLLRKITWVIKHFYKKNILPIIYSDSKGKQDKIDKNCAFWGDQLGLLSVNADPVELEIIDMLNDLLILFQEDRIDPNLDNEWKLLLKLYYPRLFYKTFERFGQVTGVSAMDPSESDPGGPKKVKDIKDVGW